MVKKVLLIGLILAGFICPQTADAYNYGDFRSSTLVSKAWQASGENDLEAVMAYVNKTIELYDDQARKMQESLTEYPVGTDEEVFAYWALNDIATALYVQGEAYRNVDMLEESKAAYQKVIDDYSYGQCWDAGGWFWKPAEAAAEKIAMLDSGSSLDFGDYASSTLATKAWMALAEKDLDAVIAYTDKNLELYSRKAQEMQSSLEEYPWESKEKIFSYWALNDVGASLFIKAEAFRNAGNAAEALKAYKILVDEYYYAQCWDPKGWFWKPAEAAQEKLDALEG